MEVTWGVFFKKNGKEFNFRFMGLFTRDYFKNSIWIGGAAHGGLNYYVSKCCLLCCCQTGLWGNSCHPDGVGTGTLRGSTEQCL